jgi:hypothetical protein
VAVLEWIAFIFFPRLRVERFARRIELPIFRKHPKFSSFPLHF